ncbi:inositol phosphate kinase 1 isoform X3 [Dermatophagoides pteronyssinus]|nr:uncharacterized protein LOC113789909 isoform X2 [Dermatophagoides pteronyssinus]KAH9425699.1 hypothetical protein DERP_004916 [Dermatophagoides pteronyssinus]
MVLGMINDCQLAIDCKFSSDQLIYRGEGNSSLVVAIQPTCQVIRLLKSDAKKLQNANDVLTHLLQHIDFNRNILPDVIGEHLFSSPQLVYLESRQLETIKSFVHDKRPSFRLEKTLTNCGYALLMNDCCTIPPAIDNYDWSLHSVIAVEIKPKQGFLPNANLFRMNDVLKLKSQICRFGLSQFYKLQKKSIKSISSYCPLDLFSGCPSRTFHALLCLMNNPQNNFRVFLNSHLLFDDQCDIGHLRSVLSRFLSVRRNGKHFKANPFTDDVANKVIDPIHSFALLLAQILTVPLCDDSKENDCQPEIYRKGNKNDYKHMPNVIRELENLDCQQRYVFYRTFIEFFEKMANLTNINDLNNNQTALQSFINDHYRQSDDFMAIKNKKSKSLTIDHHSLVQCRLHASKQPNPLFCDSLSECQDKSLQHGLPVGCILDSILRAQQLDTIDSFIAVDLMDKLFLKYKTLKHDLSIQGDCLYPIDTQRPECRERLEKFIVQNSQDLDTLWRFLISLTAKDCSIMIAMKHDDDRYENGFVQPSSTSCSSIHVTDKTTGRPYLCRLSIIDLDYKPACKIQRMLHNDRRMILTFLSSIYKSNKCHETGVAADNIQMEEQLTDYIGQELASYLT